MRVKSSGLARGLANARGGGDWAQVELTDALGSGFFFFFFERSKLCSLL